MVRIRELREKCNLMQKVLAKQLGVAANTLGYWETGKNEPDIVSLKKLAKIFGVTVDYLVGYSDEPNTPIKVVRGEILTKSEVVWLELFRSLTTEGQEMAFESVAPVSKRFLKEATLEVATDFA